MSSNAFADSDGQGGLKRFEVHEAVGSADGVHMPVEEDDVANFFSMDGGAGNARMPPGRVDGGIDFLVDVAEGERVAEIVGDGGKSAEAHRFERSAGGRWHRVAGIAKGTGTVIDQGGSGLEPEGLARSEIDLVAFRDVSGAQFHLGRTGQNTSNRPIRDQGGGIGLSDL